MAERLRRRLQEKAKAERALKPKRKASPFTKPASENDAAQELRAVHRSEIQVREGEIYGTSIKFVNPKELFPEAIRITKTMKYTELRKVKNSLDYNEQTSGTIYDRKMGPLNGFQECATCHRGMKGCPKHMGIIELPPETWFINTVALKYAYNVIQSVCNDCGHLLPSENLLRQTNIDTIEDNEYRLEMITEKALKTHVCYHTKQAASIAKKRAALTGITDIKVGICVDNPDFITKKAGNLGDIKYTRTGGDGNPMPIEDVERIFDSIPKDDLRLMGFTPKHHPRNYIVKAIVVPPLTSRMKPKSDGTIQEDPVGSTYGKIIDAVNVTKKLKKQLTTAITILRQQNPRNSIDVMNEIIDKDVGVNELKLDISKQRLKIMDSYDKILNGPGNKKKTNRHEDQGVKKSLQNKKGHMRHDMAGKRVDNFGRDVVSTGNDIMIAEIGIPWKYREELTVDEVVFGGNLDYARRLIMQGEVIGVDKMKNGVKYPKNVTKTTMTVLANTLRSGDKIHRRIRDNDIVMVNRQPTIQEQSIMTHRVKLTSLETFQVSLPHASAYKGDFDGDEYNIHVIQSTAARAEHMVLDATTRCLANKQNNFTIMYPTFEAPLDAYKLTNPLQSSKHNVLNEHNWMRLAQNITPVPNMKNLFQRLEYKNVPRFSGLSLVSAMLPEDFVYQHFDSKDADNKVAIDMGVMYAGYLTKSTLGPGHSITNAIRLEYGNERAVQFIDSATLVLDRYGMLNPTILDIKDCMPDARVVREFRDRKIYEAQLIDESADHSQQSALEAKIAESEMIQITDDIKNEGSKHMMKTIPDDNNFILMVLSGAKGNKDNSYQIMVSAGQNFYQGQRMPIDYTYNTRSLASFVKGDRRLMARGLCVHSFAEGLTPQELFFLQKAGRKNLTDTSQTTFIPGQIRRELSSFMLDIRVQNDGSVRTSSNEIVQFSYNGDGFDPGSLYKENFFGYSAPFFTKVKDTARSLRKRRKYKLYTTKHAK